MQVKKPPARVKEIKNETWSPAIKIISGDQLPIAQRSAPQGPGKPCPHQAKLVAPPVHLHLVVPLSSSLLHKWKRTLLRYVSALGVGEPTGTQTIFF